MFEKSRPPATWLTTFLMLIGMLCLSLPTYANLGLYWLVNQAQPDGHYSAPNELASPFLATAETLRTLYQLGETPSTQPSMTTALESLNAEPLPSTETLWQTLLVHALAGLPVESFRNELTNRLQYNGGLGDLKNYERTVIDTALALSALDKTSILESSIETLYPSIDFLLKQQQADGSFPAPDKEPSVSATAIVMHALWHYRHHLNHIPTLDVVPALDNAQAYLLSQRNDNGLWDETFESALALIAIVPRLSNRDEISGSLEALRAAQAADGSWDNDVYTTALALRALQIAEAPEPNPDLGQIIGTVIDGQTDLALSGVLVQLSGTATASQITNSAGEFSFSGLQAGNYTVQISTEGNAGLTTETLVQLGQPVNLGELRLFREGATTIQGIVTDATTGEPLSGATIEVTGVTEVIVTNAQGAYLVSNLEPGEVMIQASHEGYLTASTNITVTASASIVFSLALSPDVVILQGIITEGHTQMPLANVNIFLNGTQATQTQADGSYRIENLSSGEINILIEQQGYDSVITTISLPSNTIMNFSPHLYPTGSNPSISDNASVIGLVIDKATSTPLSGVRVTNGIKTTTTDNTGQFNLTNLAAGGTTLQLSLADYRDETLAITLSPFTHLDLGEITLIPNNYQIPVGVKGIVMDASTNQALADVNILAQFGETTQTLASNAEGLFDITGSIEDNLSSQLSFTIEGYVSYTLDILLTGNKILDIGQVRLRPEKVTVLLPDLVVNVDNTGIHTDPQTLTISGNVMANVSNIGTAPTSSNIALLSFYDVDLNGVYETEIDISLGEAIIQNSLAVEENANIAISLAGELAFRDAPIKVWVDNLQAIVESDEKNNVGTTTKICEVEPEIGVFEPILKWKWTGGTILPEYKQVGGTPVVAPIEDTNHDGKINQFDIPAVIFPTYKCEIGRASYGILRAISGKDGSDLWAVSDYNIYSFSNIAVADIDHDGIVEIIAPTIRDERGVIAFEHTGDFKWQSSESHLISPIHTMSIADLNDDNTYEIISGSTVLNSVDGSLLWNRIWNGKGGYDGLGVSVVADIDLDGKAEVIASASAYSNTGQLLWAWPSYDIGNGLTAVGNFNEDNYPEIVAVSFGRVFLLDYRGEIIWGPVYIPGIGWGGSPTIADVNGDGMPEIGIAAKTSYVVFDAKGSLLGYAQTLGSSDRTGSSSFDFEGNGQAKLLHASGRHLRVYQWTGEELIIVFEVPNTHGTAYELPVIADVDNDNHADIVVGSNAHYLLNNSCPDIEVGIRVYQDKNNSWANTRKIWNQYSYHITNINDDGTVPAVEPNSWEVHNTYRSQPVLGGGIAGIPDLTAGHLQLIDNGVAQAFTLQVRIGNGGAGTSSPNMPITFYAGDPASNGLELGTVMLDSLAPGTYQDVQLEDVTLADLTQDIYAVVDAGNNLEECNEGNNSVFTSITGNDTTLAHFDLNVTTDAPEYGPNTPVEIEYTVSNQGALVADFQVEIFLQDNSGNTIEVLKTPTLETLAGGDTLTNQIAWETGTTLAGTYQIQVILLSATGDLVTETSQPFTIKANEEIFVTVRANPDKPTYHTTEVVLINSLVQNVSVNTLVDDALLVLTIRGPDGQVVHAESQALKLLPPSGRQNVLLPYLLNRAKLGTYQATIRIEGYDNTTLASQQTTFMVTENLTLSVVGQVASEVAQLSLGQIQTCTATVTNQGTQAMTNLAVQYLLVNLETSASVKTQTASLDLTAGASHSQALLYQTLSLPVAHYACVLQAQLENDWQVLDFQTFHLHEILSSECSTVYASHDEGRSDTQLFSYNLNEGTIEPLGPKYPLRDLEGLDIHPYTYQLYASSGQRHSRLYQVDGYNGDLTPIGSIGFHHVEALSFHPQGNLWGSSDKGLLNIDTDTGQGQLVYPADKSIEGLAWNNSGTLLYGTTYQAELKQTTLWVYDGQTLHKVCDNLPGEVESLEMLPDNHLAFGIHQDKQLSFHVYDINQCQVVTEAQIQTSYNDIEGIAWPSANCTAIQLALRAFLTALSESDDIFLGQDRNLRAPLENQVYQGQLAELVTQGSVPEDGQLHLVAIADANEDGIDDFLITYPDGKQQVLYYLGTTTLE